MTPEQVRRYFKQKQIRITPSAVCVVAARLDTDSLDSFATFLKSQYPLQYKITEAKVNEAWNAWRTGNAVRVIIGENVEDCKRQLLQVQQRVDEQKESLLEKDAQEEKWRQQVQQLKRQLRVALEDAAKAGAARLDRREVESAKEQIEAANKRAEAALKDAQIARGEILVLQEQARLAREASKEDVQTQINAVLEAARTDVAQAETRAREADARAREAEANVRKAREEQGGELFAAQREQARLQEALKTSAANFTDLRQAAIKREQALQTQLEQSRQELKRFEEEVFQREEVLRAAAQERAEQELVRAREKDEARAREEAVRKRAEEMYSSREANEAAIRGMRAAALSLKQKNTALEQDNAVLRTRLAQLSSLTGSAASAQVAQVEALQAQLREREMELAEFRNRVMTLDQASTNLAEVQQLREQFAGLKQASAEQTAASEAQISELTTQLQVKDAQLAELNVKLQAKKTKLEEVRKGGDTTQLEQQVANWKARADALKVEIDALQTKRQECVVSPRERLELAELRAQLQHVTEKRDEADAEVVRLMEAAKQRGSDFEAKLQEENKALKVRVKSLKNANATLQNENTAWERRWAERSSASARPSSAGPVAVPGGAAAAQAPRRSQRLAQNPRAPRGGGYVLSRLAE